jgi:3-oxoacyl-[acyl-carrier protein] reductase
LVTGGSRGIGAAIAHRLAEEGANIAITYARSQDSAQQIVDKINKKGVRAEALQVDAANALEVRGLISKVVELLGGLNILVNNAGVYSTGVLEEITEEAFDETVAVNIRAVFLAAQEAAKVMPPGSRIINIGSVFGERVPFPGISLYSMSKFAVAGFTRGWARDIASKGITVNCIQPGPIDTDMNPENSEFANTLKQMTALGRYGKPRDIGETVAFLASSGASYLTGSIINVDGGFEA